MQHSNSIGGEQVAESETLDEAQQKTKGMREGIRGSDPQLSGDGSLFPKPLRCLYCGIDSDNVTPESLQDSQGPRTGGAHPVDA